MQVVDRVDQARNSRLAQAAVGLGFADDRLIRLRQAIGLGVGVSHMTIIIMISSRDRLMREEGDSEWVRGPWIGPGSGMGGRPSSEMGEERALSAGCEAWALVGHEPELVEVCGPCGKGIC